MTPSDPRAVAEAVGRIAQGSEDDRDFRAVCTQLEIPSPSDAFVGAVMVRTRQMALDQAPPHVFTPSWRGLAAACVGVAAMLGILVQASDPLAAAAMVSARWAVWLMTGGLGLAGVGPVTGASVDAWSTLVGLGGVFGRALTSAELVCGLAVSTGVGGASLYGLVRELSADREESSWVDPT
jgi:hypothetical protein